MSKVGEQCAAPRQLVPAMFFDRDDTLVDDVGYVGDPGLLRLLPGAAEALRAARAAGFRLYLVTNQSGIGRGYYTLADAERCNARLEEMIFGAGEHGFDGICIAPEKPGEPSRYRKPSPAYPLERIAEDGLDPARSFIVGDKTSDLLCGDGAGIVPMLVFRGAKGAPRDDAAKLAGERGFPVCGDVGAAVAYAIARVFGSGGSR